VFITLSSAYATCLRIRVMLALVLVGYERNHGCSIAHARFVHRFSASYLLSDLAC
jgi:hypothetical protein